MAGERGPHRVGVLLSGRTVTDVIEDALRHAMTARDSGAANELAPLPTFGGSGVLPGIDLASGAALRDAMEQDVGDPLVHE